MVTELIKVFFQTSSTTKVDSLSFVWIFYPQNSAIFSIESFM